MTQTQLFTNNAVSLLQNAIGPTDMSITVQPGLGALFPQPTNPGDFFLITLEPINAPLIPREIIQIIGRTGDVLTVGMRGFEATGVGDGQPGVGEAWPALTTLVDHRVTAYTMYQAMLLPTPPVSGSGGIVYAPTSVPATTTQGVVQTARSLGRWRHRPGRAVEHAGAGERSARHGGDSAHRRASPAIGGAT